AALTLWAATGLGVAADPALLGAAAVLAGLGAIAAALRLRRRARARGRHRDAPGPRPAAAVLLVLAALCAGLASTAVQVHARSTGLLADLDGASAVLVGHVTAEPRPVSRREWESLPRQRLELRLTEVAGRGQAGHTRAPVVLVGPPEWAEVALGEVVRVRASVRATPPGDAAAAVATARAGPTVLARPGGHLAVVNDLRRELRGQTADLPPHARGLVPGIAVGDDRALPADLAAAMRATSLTHLTAVSGAHVAIVLGVVLAALAWVPRRWRAGAAVVVLVALVTLVRPEASVLRAAVMGVVVLAALALGRPARALPGLCTAVVVLLLVDPWLGRAYGFVLSVLATGGLVLLARPWTRWLARWVPRWLAAAVALPAAAQAACAPVVVLLQPAVATYAVPANLLAAPAVPPATVLGVAATLLAPLWPGGAHALVHLA
ncbi:ComEC/Rec2 family competence protein, partial [Georgenia thermotolerans]